MSNSQGMVTAGVAINFKPKSGVYGLADPRTGRIQYAGQAVDIEYRYRQHIDPNVFDSNREKAVWIAGLRNLGLLPTLVILAECDWPESDEIEKQFIKNFKLNGQCELNRAPGGKTNRSVSKLSNGHKDDWFQLGCKVKEVRELLVDISREAGELGGAKATGFAIEAIQGVDRFKARLERMLVKAFPEWADISRVFYGETDPRED